MNQLPGRLRLIYLPVRARAEAARMMLAYAKVPYEDVVLPFDAFFKLKAQGRFPFSQLPVLQVILHETPQETSKVTIAQSGSICRYLAPYTGLLPKDPLEAAVCDSYFEAGQDMALANPIVNIFTEDVLERAKRSLMKRLPGRVNDIARVVSGNEDFLMGPQPSYCDFNVLHHLQQVGHIAPELLDQHPCLRPYMTRVEKLPGVSEYLDKRPPLEQLGRNLLPGKGATEEGQKVIKRIAGL